jgi:hypothetical protein
MPVLCLPKTKSYRSLHFPCDLASYQRLLCQGLKVLHKRYFTGFMYREAGSKPKHSTFIWKTFFVIWKSRERIAPVLYHKKRRVVTIIVRIIVDTRSYSTIILFQKEIEVSKEGWFISHLVFSELISI